MMEVHPSSILAAQAILLLLASADVKGFHYDVNAFFTELVKDPVRRGQFEQSPTISHPFLKNFTLSVKSGTSRSRFFRETLSAIFGRRLLCTQTLVFDVGFNHGLTHTSTQ
jgi:hypothetical protein